MKYDYYFLSYPDNFPDGIEDPINAASEMYVEVGNIERREIETYSFYVYTIKFIEENFLKRGKGFFVGSSVIIVEKFIKEDIERAIENMLPEIKRLGIYKG